jgi:hypothetical protein
VFGAQVGQNLPLIVKKLFSIFSAIQWPWTRPTGPTAAAPPSLPWT